MRGPPNRDEASRPAFEQPVEEFQADPNGGNTPLMIAIGGTDLLILSYVLCALRCSGRSQCKLNSPNLLGSYWVESLLWGCDTLAQSPLQCPRTETGTTAASMMRLDLSRAAMLAVMKASAKFPHWGSSPEDGGRQKYAQQRNEPVDDRHQHYHPAQENLALGGDHQSLPR